MKNYANGPEIPIGFGMELVQNAYAMDYFTSLSEEKKQQVLSQARNVQSKREMEIYVQSLANNNNTFS
ncbi:MAG: hypothetical protein K0R15_2483 [Clostridiales bacterium]|jgi:hypothetical protein|nr:hypothetical protein [Clostridiales bacterium]